MISNAATSSEIPLKTVSNNAEGVSKTNQSKSKRIGSKLSSRNSRRKRRERENKGRSAIAPHGERGKSEVPIPSFTPIIEERHHEVDTATDMGCVCQSEISINSLTDKEARSISQEWTTSVKPKSVDQDLDTHKIGSGNIWDSDLVHPEKQNISSEVPKAPRESSTTKYSTTKEAQTVNDFSSKQDAEYGSANQSISSTIQIPSANPNEDNRMVKNLIRRKSIPKRTSMSQHHETSNDCPKERESDLVVETLPFEKARTALVNMPSCSSFVQKNEATRQLDSDIVDGSDSEGANAKANTVGSSKIATLEVIEIDLEGTAVGTQGACERGEKKKAKAKRKNQRANRRKTKISRSSSDDEIVPRTKVATVKKSKGDMYSVQPEESGNKKRCFACSTCKCNSRSGISTTPQTFSSLSGSSARQEQSLVNRLQRIERDIAWKEGQRNDVARELKKCRGRILKKWEAQSSNAKTQRPRFLSDVDTREDSGSLGLKMNSEEIIRASNRIFGRPKGGCLQQTLTQIISAPEGDNDGIKSKVKSNGGYYNDLPETSNTYEGKHGAGSSHDFLSFWDDSEPIEDSSNCLGSMNFFKNALSRSKDMKSTGRWAKATANILRIEEEEGFEELVELFDASCDSHHSIVHCGTSDGDKENRRISLNHREVVKEIESSVRNDPERIAAIERMCPCWKENIEFAQAQTDPMDLLIALQNVQQAKKDLDSMKKRILQAFLDRRQTLDLYETSLQVAVEHPPEIVGEAVGE